MVIAVPIGPSWCGLCHSEGIGCSTSYGVTSNWMRSPEIPKTSDNFDSRFRCKNLFLGDTQLHWWRVGRKNCISTVSVAADYPDSVPESSNYVAKNGYHPLEELKSGKRVRETKLTGAEIAKTTIEANSSALLIFPATVHSEPHEHISWAEYPYVIDDGGDIYFRVPDDANIMHDPEASNPVNVLIGMDLPLFENQLLSNSESRNSDNSIDDNHFFDEYDEEEGPDMLRGPMEWNMPMDSAGYTLNALVTILTITMINFILFTMFTFAFLFVGLGHSKPFPPLPPGPKPLPFIGSLITMLRNKPTFRWIHRMMDEMNTKIMCMRIGNVHIVVVTDPKIACAVLKEKDEIFASRPDCMSGYLASIGYLNTALAPMSDHWKKMRKILATEILSVARHKWLQNKRDEEADNLLRYIYNQCETNVASTKGVVNIRIIAQQYTSNIIRKIVFGTRYFGKGRVDGGYGDEELEHADSLLTINENLFAFCVTDYFPWLRWITDFDGHEKIIRKAIRTATKYQDPLIDERIQQWKDGVKTEINDLLDVFINLEDPGLDAQEIKAQILDLMLASLDNASNNVEWVLAEMINDPRIFNKVIQELDSVVGKERLVQESDLVHLNYLKACVRESFRLHPVAAFNIPHVPSKDTTVGGYFIPKGSHVLLSRLGLGRNPDVWIDPLTFNPERHLKNGDDKVVLTDHNLELLSFSTGRRACAGVLLGSTMTVMLLARLVQGFTWELPNNETHVDLNESLQKLSKANSLLAVAKPRLPHHLYPKVE